MIEQENWIVKFEKDHSDFLSQVYSIVSMVEKITLAFLLLSVLLLLFLPPLLHIFMGFW